MTQSTIIFSLSPPIDKKKKKKKKKYYTTVENKDTRFVIQIAFDAVRKDIEGGQAFPAAIGTIVGLMSIGLLPFELGQRALKGLTKIEFRRVTGRHKNPPKT